MAPCGALSVTVREPTDACYCFCVRFVGTWGPRRDHQTVSPVLGTIASVIGSNRLCVLHFCKNCSIHTPKAAGDRRVTDRIGASTAALLSADGRGSRPRARERATKAMIDLLY